MTHGKFQGVLCKLVINILNKLQYQILDIYSVYAKNMFEKIVILFVFLVCVAQANQLLVSQQCCNLTSKVYNGFHKMFFIFAIASHSVSIVCGPVIRNKLQNQMRT